MKKKLLVFPLTYSNREIVLYKKYMKEYTLTAAVVWNQTDLRFIRNKLINTKEIFITEEYEKALAKCDAVLFLDDENMNISNPIYKDYIQKALNSNKEIRFSKKCRELLDISYSDICAELNNREILQETAYIKYIDVPVIGVMGLGDFCNKFSSEIEIASFFREQGYQVIHFGSKDFDGILREKRYPDFLFNQKYSVTKRILGWNQYLFDICNEKSPDLIVLGMPGGIMPLNNKILNEFGEIPFIISNGIRIDVGVLCSYFYEKVDQNYLTEYKNFCKYKLNCDVKWICVSNSACRFEQDSEESALEYLHYEPEIANKMVIDIKTEKNMNFFNILNDTSREEMMQQLYEELTESVSAF